jgi:flavin-dependent trigonelline monooxygenase, reductase component
MMRSVSDNPSAVDSFSLRQAYGAFTTGVAVIGTHAKDETPVGMTVNSFTTVSLVPPLISFRPARSCFAFPIYCTMTHFSANILQENQRSISDRFARSGQGSKWEGVRFQLGEYGVPLIEDALASFECSVQDRVEAGDHTIVIGRVLRIHALQMAEPLLFYRSQYRRIRELDDSSAPDALFLGWGL